MTIKTFFFLLSAILVSANCFSQKKNKGFVITGTAVGFADSTRLYLEDRSDPSGSIIDSSYIINARFRFKGKIKEKVLLAMIRTRDFSDYRMFWLENSIITFNAKKREFREGIIAGSQSQDDQNKLDAAIKSTGKEQEQNILFIRNNPNSIVSAEVLEVYSSSWGRDTSGMLYQSLSAENKNTSFGKQILEFITLNKNLKLGDRYVDFSQPDIEGKVIKLSDFDGKVVLLEFWGSWCTPCREGHPALIKIYHEFKDKGFEILGVAADTDKKDWIEAVQKDSLPWSNITELNGDRNKAVLIYGVSSYPYNFLIDKKGIIVAKDLRGTTLRSKLKELLN